MNIFVLFDKYQSIFSNTSFICLFLSTLFYWISFNFKTKLLIQKIGQTLSILSNLCLFIILANRWLVHGYFPLSNLYESLLFLSWSLLSLYLFLESKIRTNLIGAIILPVILLLTGFADLTLPIEMQKASPLVPALQSNWLMMHVSLMMLSYATLIIGSLLSILFLVLNYRYELQNNSDATQANQKLVLRENILGTIQNKEISSYTKTTSLLKILENIDNLSYRIISFGFPLLTIGIIAGAVWANEAWGAYWSWDPQETWALITWLIFASYLHARIIKGWEGKQSATLGALGFFAVWICYLGVNFLGQGLHSYGWVS